MGSAPSSGLGPRMTWVSNLKSSDWGGKWGDIYPRATVSPDGVIRIQSRDGLFCPLPPQPYPKWLVENCEIPPQAWQELIFAITTQSLDLMESLGYFDQRGADLVKFWPTHCSQLAAHIRSLELQWKRRGFSMQFHQAQLTNIKWRRHIREADMNHWIEFIPRFENCKAIIAESSSSATAAAPLNKAETLENQPGAASAQPITNSAGPVPQVEGSEGSKPNDPHDLKCDKCGTSAHISTAKYCHQCAALLRR